MRSHIEFARSSCVVAAAAGLALALWTSPPRADAQIKSGTYRLHQPHQQEPVGWSYRSADGVAEWWATIEGQYQWATPANGIGDPWRLDAVAITAPQWTSWSAFRADVLARPETQGKTVVFQQHAVAEESVGN